MHVTLELTEPKEELRCVDAKDMRQVYLARKAQEGGDSPPDGA